MEASYLDQREFYSNAVRELDELYMADVRRKQPPALFLAYLVRHPYRPEDMTSEEDEVSWPRLINLFARCGITAEDFRELGVKHELTAWLGGTDRPASIEDKKDLIEKLQDLLKRRIG